MKTVTVIDTFAFFFRAYFALPPLKSKSGFPTGLLTGFINFVHQLQSNHQTDYIIFALDSKENFRKEIYPEYKANRPSPPDDLKEQLGVAIEWIKKMGFHTIEESGYEADDVIASIAEVAKQQGLITKIVSSDKDLYQLIEDNKVFMYDWVKRVDIKEEQCLKKFEIEPKYFTDFQAILGDTSDNIPGVKGIGQKGASKLINEFENLEGIYENIDKAGTARIQKLLLESKDLAFVSRELVTLKRDVFKECDIESFKFEDKNYLSALIDEFKKYDLNTALKWAMKGAENQEVIDDTPKEPQKTFEAITLDTKKKLQEEISKIYKNSIVAFDTETTSLNTKEAKLVGFSFATNEQKAFYVPIAHSYLGVPEQVDIADAKEAILKILEAKVVGQNLKFDFKVLEENLNITPPIAYADTMIMAWLLEAGSKVGLDYLSGKFLNYEPKSFKDMVKKGDNFSGVAIEDATFYAAEDAWVTLRLFNKLESLFKMSGLDRLLEIAKDIEYPFINILMKMESSGIKVDTKHLKELKEKLSKKLDSLSSKIYEIAGIEFNIRSPKQMADILFNKLMLKGGKKTKSGYSTNEAVLNSLVNEHEIIKHILEYREHHKMLSTYVEPLLKLAQQDEKSRIYTSFLQTGTATGRLSSKDPNLQNIPVRSELGREVRGAFVAKDGYDLISIDYSQIELRLLAHFSKDKALLEAFKEDKDIHLETAVRLFGEDLAQEKRNFAKSINFGLLYGMGSRKLSQELGITTKEAKEIIENYFKAFPTVKNYLEQIKERVKNQGYVKTLIGRRRVFDYENANAMAKAAIEREGVNSVFQGSAADLIKLSMHEISQYIKEESIDGNMLLQIHDELIFEVNSNISSKIAQDFANIMQNIYDIEVPLKCSVSIAKSWDKLK